MRKAIQILRIYYLLTVQFFSVRPDWLIVKKGEADTEDDRTVQNEIFCQLMIERTLDRATP